MLIKVYREDIINLLFFIELNYKLILFLIIYMIKVVNNILFIF